MTIFIVNNIQFKAEYCFVKKKTIKTVYVTFLNQLNYKENLLHYQIGILKVLKAKVLW